MLKCLGKDIRNAKYVCPMDLKKAHDKAVQKKISDIVAKLYGGALIIEKAGKLSERTVAKLNKAM